MKLKLLGSPLFVLINLNGFSHDKTFRFSVASASQTWKENAMIEAQSTSCVDVRCFQMVQAVGN